MKDQLDAAHNRMAEFDSIDRALGEAPETYLTQLDIPSDSNEKVRSAVAVGNPTLPAISPYRARSRFEHPDHAGRYGEESRSLREEAPNSYATPVSQARCRQSRLWVMTHQQTRATQEARVIFGGRFTTTGPGGSCKPLVISAACTRQ
ncbi:hypothetical protein I553_9251 [Mycobacterium xenopi 4042]|uniref:Uncharacterized protein n=1 Tax=Mycobacterium xenopi 4042 TaxID=1299334 RepID=X8A7Z3_MYCXE|nr:hypothetical protein I553_9251 [Mycobacterium xenopi 4042]